MSLQLATLLAGRVKPTKMFFLTAMLEGIVWAMFAREK